MTLEFIVDEIKKRCNENCYRCIAYINEECIINHLVNIISETNNSIEAISKLMNR